MSANSNQVMNQIDMLALAEHEIATARSAMATPTPSTATTITHALNRASFLIWAVTQEQRDPTAPDATSPVYLYVRGEH